MREGSQEEDGEEAGQGGRRVVRRVVEMVSMVGLVLISVNKVDMGQSSCFEYTVKSRYTGPKSNGNPSITVVLSNHFFLFPILAIKKIRQ